MKIAALTRNEWLRMLILGSWLPAILVAVLACILNFNNKLLSVAVGIFLQSAMLLGDGWWCVKMHPDYAMAWLFASFISRLFLSMFVIYLSIKSGFPLGLVSFGYILSMVYCLYQKTQLQQNQAVGADLCHSL